jgi:hypothetical protein
VIRDLLAAIDEWLTSKGITPVYQAIAAFALFMALLIYVGAQFSNQDEPSPCGPNGFPGRCYHVPEKICTLTWNHAEKGCRDFVGKLKLPPGRPIGATVFRCQFVELDRAFMYVRKSTPDCNSAFAEVEDWKRANGL